MKIMITGIRGFVGHHLARELIQHGHQICGLDREGADLDIDGTTIPCASADILNPTSLPPPIKYFNPDGCIHLAAIASPPIGNQQPQLMMNTNVLGTQFLLEALRDCVPQCRVLLASTAYVYGMPDADAPLPESTPLRPQGIYALSKAAAELATMAATDTGIHAMVARAANHTGRGQSADYVVPAFATQINKIKRMQTDNIIRVGNLESERSFLDVRDVVSAYRLLIEHGRTGEAYNVGTHENMTMQTVLDELLELADIKVSIEIDQRKYRPTDRTPLLDCTRLKQDTGWQPQYTRQQTLREVLDACD